LSRLIAWEAGAPERRFTVGGSAKSVARCHRTVLAYWKFESISLQRRGRANFAVRAVNLAAQGLNAIQFGRIELRGRPARRRSTAFRDGWTAWRRRASRNPAAPRNAVSPWEAGAPRGATSRWEAAANPWLGAIARCSRTGSSNPSPSSEESANFRSLSITESTLTLTTGHNRCAPQSDRGEESDVVGAKKNMLASPAIFQSDAAAAVAGDLSASFAA
jgi:hypothetical protein